MANDHANLPLSRCRWTLARYLSERSPAPMPPMVRAGDDALHVAKLAVSAPLGRTVYVVDENERYVGIITEGKLARAIFEHLDPALYLDEHPRAVTRMLHLKEDTSKLTARSFMNTAPHPVKDQETIAGAMRILHNSKYDELPVINMDGRLVGVIRVHDILREWIEDTLLVQLGDETESFY